MGRRPKQTSVPGTEPKTVKEVTDAAEAYAEFRDQRQSLGRDERGAKLKLIEAMRKANLTSYRDPNASPPFTVTLTEGETKVKVKRDGEADNESDEGEE